MKKSTKVKNKQKDLLNYPIVKWLHVEKQLSGFLDWNRKASYDYYIKIPFWLVRAIDKNMTHAEVRLYDKIPAGVVRMASESRAEESMLWAKWKGRVSKMRKINNGYIKIIKK